MIERHSETEENYLKAIFKYSEGGEMVSTNTIAKDLGTTPASVTDMLKRLSEKQMVEYVPYRGVRLTSMGEKIALGIIRKHRLWELFLVKVLNFSWDKVHDTAEQLEHINSPELVEKLDEFLGFPKFDPHGDPIPSKDGVMAPRMTQPLPALEVGAVVTMAGVLEHSPEFLQYLDRLGMNIGAQITIVERIGFDQSLLLRVQDREIVLSGEFAKQILAKV
jgi:DtxR family Mn-dependent transcriptional regulator